MTSVNTDEILKVFFSKKKYPLHIVVSNRLDSVLNTAFSEQDKGNIQLTLLNYLSTFCHYRFLFY